MPTTAPRRKRRRATACSVIVALHGLVAPALPPAGTALPLLAAAETTAGVPFLGVLPDPTIAIDGSVPDTAMPNLPSALPPVSDEIAQGPAPSGLLGIPSPVLSAYQAAATDAPTECRLAWPVLAAVGRVESGHASGGRVDATGQTLTRILGPRLDGGPGIAAIRDTDRGVLDGDTIWDRAVGPMQFIPSTWRLHGRDGSGDSDADPHNVHDAAAAAAAYLCSAGGDLSTEPDLLAALMRYNRSRSYGRTVLTWARAYAAGVTPTAPLPGPPQTAPLIPPAPLGPAPLPDPIAPLVSGPTAVVPPPHESAAPPPLSAPTLPAAPESPIPSGATPPTAPPPPQTSPSPLPPSPPLPPATPQPTTTPPTIPYPEPSLPPTTTASPPPPTTSLSPAPEPVDVPAPTTTTEPVPASRRSPHRHAAGQHQRTYRGEMGHAGGPAGCVGRTPMTRRAKERSAVPRALTEQFTGRARRLAADRTEHGS